MSRNNIYFNDFENDFEIIEKLEKILREYTDNNILNRDQREAVINYYSQAYALPDSVSFINNQLSFIENETLESKKLKVKLLDIFSLSDWVIWVFGKIIVYEFNNVISIKVINGFVRDYFIERRIYEINKIYNTIVKF